MHRKSGAQSHAGSDGQPRSDRTPARVDEGGRPPSDMTKGKGAPDAALQEGSPAHRFQRAGLRGRLRIWWTGQRVLGGTRPRSRRGAGVYAAGRVPSRCPCELNIAAYEQALVSSAAERLHQTALEGLPGKLKAVERVVQGPVALEIVEVAEEEGADLIVIGTHGATGIRCLLWGSVAEKVVRVATCLVLTVHCSAPEHARRR